MLEFKLTPAYCLFNGVAIIEQKGSEILFLVENLEDLILQERLRRAFLNYLEIIIHRGECPETYKKEPCIEFIAGTREQLRKCVSGLYKMDGASESADEKFLEDKENRSQKEAAAILLLDTLLQDARDCKASDIHIEGNRIRFRIGGRLEPQLEVQNEKCRELIQRIKLLAGMNVIESRKSQDGRFIYGNSHPVFIRVSSVGIIGKSENWEESLVLRLLDTSRIPLSINILGFNENQLEKIDYFKNLKNGLVLVCGPTGAGKSTTVASILVELEKSTGGKIKIISLEDPPEYVIPGVTQIHIDENKGSSFADALAHVFRQDPDVIMIGEIRDEVSAAAAIRAALTGHLVFATLHTGGAGESVLRMENLGADRKILASVLKGVICQTLDYDQEHPSLCADVAVPDEGFASAMQPFFSEEQIDELFLHYTNYSEVLKKTLISMNEEKSVRKTRKHGELWMRRKNDQEFYKTIG